MTIEKELRVGLTRALKVALQAYETFAGASVPDAAKEFQDHQAACKAAVAHIELLVKLAERMDQESGAPDLHAALGPIIHEALDDVKSYKAHKKKGKSKQGEKSDDA